MVLCFMGQLELVIQFFKINKGLHIVQSCTKGEANEVTDSFTKVRPVR